MDWSSFSIGNAAGFIKGPGTAFDEALRSAATDITIGSITMSPREGNSGNVYHLMHDGTSVNALGLPNPGIKAIQAVAENMSERAGAVGKTPRWSIAGFSVDDYVALAEALFEYGRLELNLGCPNVWGDSGQKPIASFDIALMSAIVSAVSRRLPDLYFDIKVSPYSDPSMVQRVADLVRNSRVYSIVTCNTYPNGMAHNGKRRELDTPGGYGGVGGNALFPIALGQVAQFVSALEGTGIHVIGVGGIDSGERTHAMHDVGASGIQIGTAYGERGARVFSNIFTELSLIP